MTIAPGPGPYADRGLFRPARQFHHCTFIRRCRWTGRLHVGKLPAMNLNTLGKALPGRVILALTVVLFLSGTGLCKDDHVQLVTGDWMPYCSASPEEPGITVEIVTAAFDAVGIRTSLKFMPWPRCKLMVREGMDVAAFPYVRTAERERFARFSVPLLTERTYLYYARQFHEGFDFTGYEALRKYRVGTLHGFVHQELLEANRVPAVVVNNTKAGLEMLLRSRLDFFPVNELVAKREIHRNFEDVAGLFGRTATPMYEVDLHLMVSSGNPRADHILASFAKGMALIRENGLVRKIILSYE